MQTITSLKQVHKNTIKASYEDITESPYEYGIQSVEKDLDEATNLIHENLEVYYGSSFDKQVVKDYVKELLEEDRNRR